MRPLWPRTLRGRMVAVTVVIAALVVTALVVLLQMVLDRASQHDALSLATARADGVGATIRMHDGRPSVVESATDELDRTAWVYDARGHLLDGRLPRRLDAPAQALALAGANRSLVRGDDLLLSQPVRVAGSTVAVVVATVDLTPYENAEGRSLWITIALGVLTVVLAGAVAQQVGRYALAAVHEMSARADEWQEHDLDHRFALGRPVDEITELGRTLDRLLDRISGALSAERRLTDEIAHELRTPLTAVRAEAQLLGLTGDAESRVAAARIVEGVDRLEASIRTLLDAARARDLGEGGCDVVTSLAPLLPDGRVRAPSEGVWVAAGGELVRALVGPLVDNARAHARSRVEVRVERAGAERVRVLVLDDGPGVAEEEAERVFEPGRSGRGGTGLGLAVVRRLATSANAQVRAVPGDHGRFEVTLPTS